jgi:hypothetical protein
MYSGMQSGWSAYFSVAMTLISKAMNLQAFEPFHAKNVSGGPVAALL